MRRISCLFLVVGLLSGGCVSYTAVPSSTESQPTTSGSPGATRSPFEYERAPIPFQNDVLDEEETRNYLVRYIRFPSIGDNRQRRDEVTAKYYESKHPGKKPLVIVLPIWGGHVLPSKKMTLHLKKASGGEVNVFRMLGEQNLTDWWGLKHAPDQEAFMNLWESTAQAERNTIVDVRRTIDWVLARPEVDPDRIALIGFSRGAILAAVTAAIDLRLAATVLVMGGAHPHKAISACPMLRGEGVQRKVQKEYGWTLDEFADRLKPIYADLDPANYPGRSDPQSILIVEASKDDCIPPDAREAFWQAMGRPQRILIPRGHKRAFISMTPVGTQWLQKEIWSFLRDTL